MKLFAYGTLMAAEGFRSALGDRAAGLTFQPARLAGWKRAWNAYRPDWDGAVLNIEPDPQAVVVGVLVDGLTDLDWALLDDQERTHLPREPVSAELAGGERVPAETYRMRNASYGGARSPRYEATVLERARAAGADVLADLRLTLP